MEKFAEVTDSLAVGTGLAGRSTRDTVRQAGRWCALTEELQARIRKTLRQNASPRHVPALIVEAPDIPYTLNMKKVEGAVTNILNGRPVLNQDALINPGSLEFYRDVAQRFQA